MPEHEALDRAISCAFTGHRPELLPWGTAEDDPRCVELKAKLDRRLGELYDRGFRHFLCGMAKGADFYFGEAVLRLKDAHPDVRLEAAVPFPEQSAHWSRADRERHRALLARCDLETLIQQTYTQTCMQRRNRYMVDHAACLLAVYNGRPEASGTLNTISYALQKGVPVDILEV